jgi:hypothetical protein
MRSVAIELMKTLLCLLPLLALNAFAVAPPPANDNFTNRTVLVSSGSISISDRNASATTEASEPTVAGKVVWRSVWYSWTPPFTGPVTISTGGSSFDTLLGVFTGTALGALTSIAENDDAGTGAFTSTVNFNAVGGIPYVILVGGYNGAGGKIQLSITVGSGPCTFTVSPTSKSFSNLSGSGTVSVTTGTGCTWSAASNTNFLTILSGSTGTGSGSVSYSISANTALTARTGTMTIAGTTVTIDQAAAPACTYSLLPGTAALEATAQTNTISMTAGTGCAWTATPNASWLTIQSGASGTGNGTITYVVAANTGTTTRTGTITAAGQTFTATQAGTTPCTYSITPTSAGVIAAGGSGSIVITTTAGCGWTASSPATWVTFTTTNGTGGATVGYTVAANASTLSRSTTLTIAGLPFALTQAGVPCTYTIAPTSTSVAAGSSSGSIIISTGAGCAWTNVVNVSWITITSGTSGSGGGTATYTVAANLNTVARSGTITAAGQIFTVNQAAAACIYSIAPTAAHYLSGGGTGSINVTAGTGCAWTAVTGSGFLTVDSGSPGSGSGVVGYTVAANATTVSRTGTITAAGTTFTVTQDGTVPCTYSIAPSSASYTSIGGSGSIAVTANAGCAWSVSSAAPWITFTPASGIGNGTVTYTVAANGSSLTQTGTLTVAGQTFTVTETGVACSYTVAPATASYGFTGGNGTATVTATAGCSWTSSSDSPWLVVTSGAAGTGNGSVGYSVSAATNSVTRTGRLTIAGKLLIVTETGIPCTFSISPTSATFDSSGGNGSIALSASDSACSWSAASSQTWATVSPPSGTGNGNVAYSVAPTSLATSRSATITVAGQTFSITQTGDTTVPVVTLTAPANGTTVSNIINVSATATDNSSVARVDFYRDAAVLIGSVAASPYSLPFQTTNVSNASHTFYARGFDPANNQGFSVTNTVTVSNSSAVNTNAWVLPFGGTSADNGQCVATDSAGNIIVAGYYSGTVNFGGGALTNAGGADIFLATYTSAGVHTWSKRFGGTANDFPFSVKVDSGGNIFLCGYFGNTIDFGGGALTSAGAEDMFIAKFSSLGNHLWSKSCGNTASDQAFSLALDPSGNVFLTGVFRGLVDFGGISLTSSGSFPGFPGGPDVFMAKYTTLGALSWVKSFTNTAADEGHGIACDTSGNVFLTGYYTGTIDFGGGTLPQNPNLGDYIYLAKFNGSGTHQWSQFFGGTGAGAGANIGQAVATDAAGNVFLTGYFSGTANFGGLPLASAGGYDVFLAQYSSSGTPLWSKSFAGTNFEVPNALTVDPGGNVLVGGYFQNTLNVGGTLLTSAGAGLQDIFIGKFTTGGSLVWAKSFGGTLTDNLSGMTTDANSFVIGTGAFSGVANFSGTSLTSTGSYDIYLMRIAP